MKGKGPSYSVYVRYRKGRLALAKAITELDDAIAKAAALRSERLHDADHVFVVRDDTDEVVDEGKPARDDGSSPMSAT